MLFRSIYRLGCLFILALSGLLNGTVAAQSGGTFVIEKSVIAGGGGRGAGGQFVLDGTVGQHLAGASSSGGGFAVNGGFWGGSGTAPSSNATVSGHVLTSDGRGLRNATVSITSSQGVVRTATTSSFGLFSFENISTGDVYTIRIISRLFRYASQTVQVNDNLTLPDFVGLE